MTTAPESQIHGPTPSAQITENLHSPSPKPASSCFQTKSTEHLTLVPRAHVGKGTILSAIQPSLTIPHPAPDHLVSRLPAGILGDSAVSSPTALPHLPPQLPPRLRGQTAAAPHGHLPLPETTAQAGWLKDGAVRSKLLLLSGNKIPNTSPRSRWPVPGSRGRRG